MNMKKIAYFLLAMVIIVSTLLSGCGSREVPDSNNVVPTQSIENIAPSEPSNVDDLEVFTPNKPSNVVDSENIIPTVPSHMVDTEESAPNNPSEVGNVEDTDSPSLPNSVNLENIEIMEELLVPNGWTLPDSNFIVIEEDSNQDFIFKANLVLDESIITDEGESLAELLNSSDHTDWMKVATCEKATSDMLIQCANNCMSWLPHQLHLGNSPFEYVTNLASQLVQHPNTCDEVIHVFLKFHFLDLLEVISSARCNTFHTLNQMADILSNIITSSYKGNERYFLESLNSIAINLLEHPASNSQIVLKLAKSDNINFWPILASASCNNAQSLEVLATLFSHLTTSQNIDRKTLTALENLMQTCTVKLLNHPDITSETVLTLANSTFTNILPILASANCHDSDSLEAFARNLVNSVVSEDSQKFDELYDLQYNVFKELINHPAATGKVVIALTDTPFFNLFELLSAAECNDSESLLVLADICVSFDFSIEDITQIEWLTKWLYSISENLISHHCATPDVIIKLADLQLFDIWELLASAECNNSESLLVLAEKCASISPFYADSKLETMMCDVAKNIINNPKCSLTILEKLAESNFYQVRILVQQAINS